MIFTPDLTRPIEAQTAAIKAHDRSVRFVEYCEANLTPGCFGQIPAVTDRERREVNIGLRATVEPEELVRTLAHEYHRIVRSEWDCGHGDAPGRVGLDALAAVRHGKRSGVELATEQNPDTAGEVADLAIHYDWTIASQLNSDGAKSELLPGKL